MMSRKKLGALGTKNNNNNHSKSDGSCGDMEHAIPVGFKNGQRGTCTIVPTSTSGARDQIISVNDYVNGIDFLI
jgi:hypothetical protein